MVEVVIVFLNLILFPYKLMKLIKQIKPIERNTMFLNHVALVCSSEEKSDRFYKDVLDLEKLQSKVISSDLSKKVFDLDNEYQVIDYGNESIKFEIFISEKSDFAEKRLSHVCHNIKNMNLFLKKCAENQVDISKIPKGDNILVFIKDYDGNMFEIKEKI